MSKITIISTLKSKNEKHIFKGKGLKREKNIIYNDKEIIKNIKLTTPITIERKGEHILIINLKEGIKLQGKYQTNYGSFKVETYTKKIIETQFTLKIIYDLIINDEYIDTFEYNFEYSIDS